jgi:hypothetical protein
MSASVNKVILQLYRSGMSIPEVSEAVGKSMSTVRYWLKKQADLRSRADGIRIAAEKGKLSHMLGKDREFSEQWKRNISISKLKSADKSAKGFSLKPNGYLEYTRGTHKGRSVHVVLMEKRIGRRLLPDECVHHIDGDKQNNNEDNLALLTRSGHSRLHRFEDALSNNVRERKENGRFC